MQDQVYDIAADDAAWHDLFNYANIIDLTKDKALLRVDLSSPRKRSVGFGMRFLPLTGAAARLASRRLLPKV